MAIGNLFRKKKVTKNEINSADKHKVSKISLNRIEFEKWKNKTNAFNNNDMAIDKFSFSKTYFDFLERYIPSVSGAIWTWCKLCNTPFEMTFQGGSEDSRNKAKLIYDELNKRINPIKSAKNGGFSNLLSIYFNDLFKYGRTSGQLIINEDLSGIKEYKVYNPYLIRFEKTTLKPYKIIDGNTMRAINENLFYYFAQSMDVDNPYGYSMLEATPCFIKILDDMTVDMANSSSNAGVPRLHVKMKQPEKLSRENDEDYIGRANTYFDSTVNNLASIGSDENFYTWDGVEIGVAGGVGSSGFVWRANRQIIDEEIITAFHLFPWVLAKSFGTTKNWVQSQFDLLMTEVDSLQAEAAHFAEWITQIDLLLNGITDVEPKGKFQRLRDPAVKNIAVAERFKIDNVLTKVKNGVVSPDNGARELGYDKAYDENIMKETKQNTKKPKSEVDESEQPVDKGKNPEKSPDENK